MQEAEAVNDHGSGVGCGEEGCHTYISRQAIKEDARTTERIGLADSHGESPFRKDI